MSNDFTINLELAATLERAAAVARRCRPLSLQDSKQFLLAALDEADRAMDYGNPGRGIDQLLTTEGFYNGGL